MKTARDIAAHYHTCPFKGAPVATVEVSALGPSFVSRELPPEDSVKHPLHSAGGVSSMQGVAGFCLSWQVQAVGFWGGDRGAKVMRVSKALVGTAGVLAPVNQAVIEWLCLGLNVAPLTVSGWHYSGGHRDASATLHTKWLLVSIFMLTWIEGIMAEDSRGIWIRKEKRETQQEPDNIFILHQFYWIYNSAETSVRN